MSVWNSVNFYLQARLPSCPIRVRSTKSWTMRVSVVGVSWAPRASAIAVWLGLGVPRDDPL